MLQPAAQVPVDPTLASVLAARTDEADFRRVLDHLPAAAYTCDPDGLITYFNGAAEAAWGRAPALNDPRDRYCGSFRLFSANGVPIQHDQCWMALAIRNRRGYNGEEIIVERPDGRRLHVLAHANPMYDADGRLVGGVNVLIDVSQQKNIEQALRETDRRKDEFLATLAHELRNPLAPLSLAAQMLTNLVKDDKAAGMIAVVQRQVDHMVRLIDDLMDISRISRGKIELRESDTDVNALLDNAVEIARPHIQAANHHLEMMLPEEPLRLHVDPVRVAQIIANLLNNAARYTPDGGRIALSARQENGEVKISVRDDGAGISSEALPQVFDLYAGRQRVSGRSDGDGLGVGLALARGLAELHGGSLTAHSDGPGRGSEFTLHLPLDEEEDPAIDAAAPEPASSAGGGPRVLVVDDNHAAASMLGIALETLGAKVRVVYDGVAAIGAAAEFRPDIVFMDIGMPGLDGHSAARCIRAQPGSSDALLIAVSGWGQPEMRQRSLDAGFDQHLVKPVDLPRLKLVLANYLRTTAEAETDGPE